MSLCATGLFFRFCSRYDAASLQHLKTILCSHPVMSCHISNKEDILLHYFL